MKPWEGKHPHGEPRIAALVGSGRTSTTACAAMICIIAVSALLWTSLQWRWSIEAQLAAHLEAEGSRHRSAQGFLESRLQGQLDAALTGLTDHMAALEKRDSALVKNLTQSLAAIMKHADRLEQSMRRQVAALQTQLANPSTQTTGPSMVADTLSLHELRLALEILESAVHRLASPANGSRPIQSPLGHFETQPWRYCNLRCNARGLSVKIPKVTEGCECSCTGGWRGAGCQRPPEDRFHYDQHPANSDAPRVVIPMEREELPSWDSLSGSERARLATCRNASVAYFLDRRDHDEFRGDRGVDFFWKLAVGSLPPYCSTSTDRVAIVDVGAHVGERRQLWENVLTSPAGGHRCQQHNDRWNDSLVLLVEPNPLNLAVLRRDVPLRTAGSNATVSRGDMIVVEVAAAHYDGSGDLLVDLSANRNAKAKGNERAYLDFSAPVTSGIPNKPSQRRLITVPVRKLSTIVQLAPVMTVQSQRPVTTISVLKIDAEGMDALVLYGAAEVLSMTQVVVFECHKLWRERGQAFAARLQSNQSATWYSLREAAEFLTKHGFDVFKVGVYYWLPITPPFLWDDVYEEHMQWSNCAAIKRTPDATATHPLHRIFSTPPSCK